MTGTPMRSRLLMALASATLGAATPFALAAQDVFIATRAAGEVVS